MTAARAEVIPDRAAVQAAAPKAEELKAAELKEAAPKAEEPKEAALKEAALKAEELKPAAALKEAAPKAEEPRAVEPKAAALKPAAEPAQRQAVSLLLRILRKLRASPRADSSLQIQGIRIRIKTLRTRVRGVFCVNGRF